jgi:hypothetical protein
MNDFHAKGHLSRYPPEADPEYGQTFGNQISSGKVRLLEAGAAGNRSDMERVVSPPGPHADVSYRLLNAAHDHRASRATE